jgi:hypothetical protein
MLTTEWLKAFAAVGVYKGGNDFVAAGASVFFLHEGLLWIITANHVLKKIGDPKDFSVLVGQAIGDQPTVVNLGELQGHLGIAWVIDETNDIAASLMPYSPEVNIQTITADNCIKFDELVPSMPCYTIGCPYGFRGVDPQTSLPLVLDGIIAGVHKNSREIYTSAPTFPGNSGGPLIAIRGPYNSTQLSGPFHVMINEPATIFLAGIMLKTATLSPPLPHGKLPNLYLGVARSADAVVELLQSEQAKAQVKIALATKG